MAPEYEQYQKQSEGYVLSDNRIILLIQDVLGELGVSPAAAGDGTIIALAKAMRDVLVGAYDDGAGVIKTSGTFTGTVTASRDWTLDQATDEVTAYQGGTWVVGSAQVGAWSVGRTWLLASGTDSVSVPGVATEATLAAINAKFNSLGQKTMAASVPVTMASNQSPIAITTPTAPPSGQLYIFRRGAGAFSGSLEKIITNATPVPTGEAAQNIDYTVPTGRTFSFAHYSLDCREMVKNSSAVLRIKVNGVAVLSVSVDQAGGGNGWRILPVPLIINAGDIVTVTVKSSTNSAQVYIVAFSGVEAPAA